MEDIDNAIFNVVHLVIVFKMPHHIDIRNARIGEDQNDFFLFVDKGEEGKVAKNVNS